MFPGYPRKRDLIAILIVEWARALVKLVRR